MGTRIETFADCLAEGNRILAWCWPCDRKTEIDIAGIVAAGRGAESMIRRRWRCTRCGQLGTITVHQPKRTGGFWGQ